MRLKECVAMILAGGQGSRLGILTQNVAKPAVPFGGKYRIIDFPLSNLQMDSLGIWTVLTEVFLFFLHTHPQKRANGIKEQQTQYIKI